AEDGIRDWSVTGVQTCALPISASACRAGGTTFARSFGTARISAMLITSAPASAATSRPFGAEAWNLLACNVLCTNGRTSRKRARSEERRVGREGWRGGEREDER